MKSGIQKLKGDLQNNKKFKVLLVLGLGVFVLLSLLVSQKVNVHADEIADMADLQNGKIQINMSQCQVFPDSPLCLAISKYQFWGSLQSLIMLPTFFSMFLFWWLFAWPAFDELLIRIRNRSSPSR